MRDKQKREVDFVVIRDDKPWFLVEAKLSEKRPSPALQHYQQATGASHAFQIVANIPYGDSDPFTRTKPISVPAQTLLSVLV